MTYNIHPLIVHFPIALLLLYSVLRVVPFERFAPSMAWRQIRQVLLLAGVLGAFAASTTGEIAERLVRPDRAIVEMHSSFAAASTWIYGLLLLGEVLFYINRYLAKKSQVYAFSKVLIYIEGILTNSAFTWILALCGLLAISLTGLLGGVMVYGTSADPIAPAVLNLLRL